MAKFIMMIGIAGSGKSTKAQELAKEYNAEIFSSDAIRGEIYGDENCQNNPTAVFNILHERIHQALKADKNAIYDATNLSAKRRTAFLKTVRAEKICYIVVATPEECITRQSMRERKVPAEAIWKQVKSFQAPWYNEGWDEIHLWNTNSVIMNIRLYSYMSLNHDNPHHTLEVQQHMIEAYTNALLFDFDTLVCHVARYHDIGKFYTKTFVNSHGEVTDIAHFYNHENVGAWYWLCCQSGLCDQDKLRGAAIITWHMAPFNQDPDKLREKLGEQLYNDVISLHEVDHD